MLLERLDISGFKSFGKRTQVKFASGITCVVGPNGCGKSNIADAIRWALGEQNVRQLRGKQLLDVIFKGTREVKPAGMAEVVLHMDNHEQRLATEYTQVDIQRRAFRSGESEFRINKAPCRLKDIRSLFMDTGLGSADYAVIEREMIDEVLSDRDEARRFLLDEAAGITRYKQRRKETLRKIAAVEEDLTRVEDVLEIEERQVRSLAYQMGKARRYQRLSSRIQGLDVALARLAWQRLEEAASGESGRLREEEQRRESLRAELHNLEAQQEQVRLDLLRVDEALTAATKKLTETEGELAENREEALIRRERVKALGERVGELERRLAESEEARRAASAELDALRPQTEMLREEIAEKRAIAEAAERAWRQAEAELKEARAELQRNQQIHIEQVRTRSDADHAIKSLEERLEDLTFQREKLAAQLQALEDRAGSLNSELTTLAEKSDGLGERGDSVREELAEIAREREARRGQVEELTDHLRKLTDEVARSESRLALLEEQARNHEGFREAVADLLRHREELPGVRGAAAELITIDSAWVKRLAPALREFSDWVVTDDDAATWQAIDWLRERGHGQITFVPLAVLAERVALEDPGLLPPEVVTASDEALEPLVTYLRTSLIPVESRDAVPEVRERTAGRRWITPEAELHAPEGWVAATSGEAPAESLWSRTQEIEALRSRLNELGAETEQLTKQQAAIEASDRQLASREQVRRTELEEYESERENLARTLLQRQAEQRLIGEEIARLQEETVVLADRSGLTEQQLGGARAGVRQLEDAEGSADALYARSQERVEALTAEKDRRGEEMSERRMALVVTESKLRDLQARIDARERAIEEARAAQEQAAADLERTADEIAESRTRIEALSEQEGELVDRRESRGGEVEERREERRQLEQELAQIDQQLRTKHRMLSEVEESLRHDEVHLARVEADRQRLRDRIHDAYEIHLEDVPPVTPPSERTVSDEETPGEPHLVEVGRPDGEADEEGWETDGEEDEEEDRLDDGLDDGLDDDEAGAEASGDATGAEGGSPAEEAERAAAAALAAERKKRARDPEDPFEGLSEEAAAERLTQLRRDRERLGPVNQLAIEEYESKKEHVRFVKTQREDLLQSRDSLLAAIERINEEASRLFKDTFDQVQAHFAQTFGTLFPGGEAKLRLEGEDPLEASIEIMARPRGKRLENISLLSSGERALTATSLLFGLYLVKPSPFCVLDEVDAPLDDANVDRFLNLIRSFSERTQFVIITHNKRTMEVADTLYGVTMQEPGISKIVSVKLEGGDLVAEDGDGHKVVLDERGTQPAAQT